MTSELLPAFNPQLLGDKGYAVVSNNDNNRDKQVIHQQIPEGVAIKRTSYGNGIFVTKPFPKGSTIYVGHQITIPNEYADHLLVTDQGCFECNTDRHTVQISPTQRWLYLFDSFMNHSCDPTTISEQTSEELQKQIYRTVAVKDMQPGDEITCDYNLFEYDCPAKSIEKCLCGANNCIGRVAGFRHLSEAEQLRRIEFVADEVLESMHADPSNRFIYIQDLKCPSARVRIEYADPTDYSQGYKMIAVKAFEPNEVIFANTSLMFPEDFRIVVKLLNRRVWVNPLTHTINRGDGKREFFYFDTFQNHSCDPNSEMKYISPVEYELCAKRSIGEGDEITSDYEDFDDQLDGTVFQCLCGASNCRGAING